jgi:hypothetical protein
MRTEFTGLLLALVLVLTCSCSASASEVYRLLQAEISGQKIGCRTYSAEGVRIGGRDISDLCCTTTVV